nr:hypothetical protein L203_02644 [Cryptococcus depauperatus CBS 7841]
MPGKRRSWVNTAEGEEMEGKTHPSQNPENESESLPSMPATRSSLHPVLSQRPVQVLTACLEPIILLDKPVSKTMHHTQNKLANANQASIHFSLTKSLNTSSNKAFDPLPFKHPIDLVDINIPTAKASTDP